MVGRLNRKFRHLMVFGAATLTGVLWFSYSAGASSGGHSIFDLAEMPGYAVLNLFAAVLHGVLLSLVLVRVLSNRMLRPVKELIIYSEKLAAGDTRASVGLNEYDDFTFMAENFRRAALKVNRSTDRGIHRTVPQQSLN